MLQLHRLLDSLHPRPDVVYWCGWPCLGLHKNLRNLVVGGSIAELIAYNIAGDFSRGETNRVAGALHAGLLVIWCGWHTLGRPRNLRNYAVGGRGTTEEVRLSYSTIIGCTT